MLGQHDFQNYVVRDIIRNAEDDLEVQRKLQKMVRRMHSLAITQSSVSPSARKRVCVARTV